MLKFLLKLIKILFIGTVWSYLYLLIMNAVLIYFWNFSTFSANSWKMLKLFWEAGGTIRTGKDYLLLMTLLLLIPLWLYGWRKMMNIRILELLLAPIRLYNEHIIKKYGDSSPRIILHNMGRTIKAEEQIEQLSKPQTPAKTDAEVNKIRSAVYEKINSVKHN